MLQGAANNQQQQLGGSGLVIPHQQQPVPGAYTFVMQPVPGTYTFMMQPVNAVGQGQVPPNNASTIYGVNCLAQGHSLYGPSTNGFNTGHGQNAQIINAVPQGLPQFDQSNCVSAGYPLPTSPSNTTDVPIYPQIATKQ